MLFKKKKEHSKVKQTIFSIALALIAVFFIAYLIQTAYPEPEYNAYCKDITDPYPKVLNEQECNQVGGTWNAWNEPDVEGNTGYCDLWTKCNEEYNTAREPYERNVFIINLFLGLVILITAFFLSVEAISTGFMGGGALLMIYGTLRYWGNLSNVLRTLFLGIALVVLVYFGYKKLKD